MKFITTRGCVQHFTMLGILDVYWQCQCWLERHSPPATWFDMLRMNGVAGVCFRDVNAAAVPCRGFFIAGLLRMTGGVLPSRWGVRGFLRPQEWSHVPVILNAVKDPERPPEPQTPLLDSRSWAGMTMGTRRGGARTAPTSHWATDFGCGMAAAMWRPWDSSLRGSSE